MEILDEEVHRNREFGRGMNVTKIMNSWTTQDAYPIVRCTRMSDGRRIRLSQLPHPVLRNITTDEHANRLWWIPISMTDASRPDFSQQGNYPRVWLTPERPTLEIPYFPPASRHHGQKTGEEENTWILLNGEFSGYTRVLYDDRNWRLISRQLVLNHTVIPQVTRAQLIDDAFTLALAELMDYQVVLELIEYLTMVNDEFVRSTAQFHLRWMKERTRQNGSLAELFDVSKFISLLINFDSLYLSLHRITWRN
jgi:aminopeptidase N